MKNKNMWSAKRWIALGLCLCSLPLAGCGETAKTIALAPTPTSNMASVQAESCQYEVSRIDQPQIENGIAAYNWVSWYAPGEHAILCGGYDITDGAWIIERVDYRYGFHEVIWTMEQEGMDTLVVDPVLAPDGSSYALAHQSDGKYVISLYPVSTETSIAKQQIVVGADAGALACMKWSADGSTCLVFFERTETVQQDADERERMGIEPVGQEQGTFAQTSSISVLACTMDDGALTPVPVDIPVDTQIQFQLDTEQLFLSEDGRMGLLQGYDAWTGESRSCVFAFNQERTAIEKVQGLDGLLIGAAWMQDDTMLAVDQMRSNLLVITDIWNTTNITASSMNRTTAQRTEMVIAPNGKAIAYAQMDKNKQWDIYVGVIGEDGTVTEKVAYKGAEWVFGLSFSPDSMRLLAQTERPSADELENGLMIIEFE